MKKIIKILTVSLLIMNSFEGNAQILKKLKEKVTSTPTNTPKGDTPLENKSDDLYTMDKKADVTVYKIIFSDKPFSVNQTESSKELFTLKDNIYGRVILDKPFKKLIYQADQFTRLNFLINDTLNRLDMDPRSSGDIRSFKEPILKEQLNSPFIDFEIWVNKSKKTEITLPTHNFPDIIYKQVKQNCI
jgi:hypothetical protein